MHVFVLMDKMSLQKTFACVKRKNGKLFNLNVKKLVNNVGYNLVILVELKQYK